jgi:hypothetical protein
LRDAAVNDSWFADAPTPPNLTRGHVISQVLGASRYKNTHTHSHTHTQAHAHTHFSTPTPTRPTHAHTHAHTQVYAARAAGYGS